MEPLLSQALPGLGYAAARLGSGSDVLGLAAELRQQVRESDVVGRTAEAGDELGSRLLSAGLAGDLLWLAFALSRRWRPYAKWRGTVFRSLPVAARLAPMVGSIEQWADCTDILSSPGRRAALQAAYRAWSATG